MIRALWTGFFVWIAVPICWFVWWYVYSAITRDIAWGRSLFNAKLMEWTIYGLFIGTVAAGLVGFKSSKNTKYYWGVSRDEIPRGSDCFHNP